MISHRTKGVLPVMVALTVLLPLLVAGPAVAMPIPNKLVLTGHFGKEVNKTGANVCGVREECQPGKESGEAGGFVGPHGVAVNSDPSSPTFGDVYVSDSQNHRVQVLTSSGEFVSMFGWDVNQTKVETVGAKQSERNVCTAKSKDVCKTGIGGPAPGQFGTAVGPQSIAVDPVSGDVYVADVSFGEVAGELVESRRVQEFTAEGQLILEIGKEVNEATQGNVCAIEEAGAKCTVAALQTAAQAEGDSQPGEFSSEEFSSTGGLLAVGGPEDLLYVGDRGRVQKFKPSGVSAGEISIAELSAGGAVRSVAVDPAGDVFLSEQGVPGVHEYSPSGQIQPVTIDPASIYAPRGIAVDARGNLAIAENTEAGLKGGLYSSSGAKLSTFEILGFPNSLAVASTGNAYLPTENEVNAYNEIAFPQTVTCPAGEVTATTAKLCGEINPDGVPAKGFFEYGQTPPLASLTPVLFTGEGETFTSLTDELTGLTPNQAYSYRTAAEATGNGEAIVGTGEEVAFHTPALPPQISGAPSSSYIGTQSADLNGSVNPEHLRTRYHYEYGPCPTLTGCATAKNTPDEVSAVYGTIGSTQEIAGLTPVTTYSYRLVASNRQIASCQGGYPVEEEGVILRCEEGGVPVYEGGEAIGPEATFTTGPGPVVEAGTGSASAISATTATISGAVNPDGQSATYAFELGVYAGAATQYGIISSGSAGSGTGPVEETLPVSGLQPGSTYAYRITIHGGYGTATGATATFTTQGLPGVLASPAPNTLLATPNIAFPTETKESATTTKALTRKQKLTKALKLCKKDRSRAKKTTCEKAAHKKYGSAKKTAKKK